MTVMGGYGWNEDIVLLGKLRISPTAAEVPAES
jgi:hypothetical protein